MFTNARFGPSVLLPNSNSPVRASTEPAEEFLRTSSSKVAPALNHQPRDKAIPKQMSHTTRTLTSNLHRPSTSHAHPPGQSPALLARVNEKKTELENLKQLRDLSAGLARQMQSLEEKLGTLADGTEGRFSHPDNYPSFDRSGLRWDASANARHCNLCLAGLMRLLTRHGRRHDSCSGRVVKLA